MKFQMSTVSRQLLIATFDVLKCSWRISQISMSVVMWTLQLKKNRKYRNVFQQSLKAQEKIQKYVQHTSTTQDNAYIVVFMFEDLDLTFVQSTIMMWIQLKPTIRIHIAE